MRSFEELVPNKRVHFVGIGGVGMSALAQIILEQGYYVTGSDIKQNSATRRLETLGAVVNFAHDKSNIQNVDLVVYSSCIKEDNPEIIQAKQKNIKLIKRGLLLSLLMQGKTGIAVAGAHGKTTTTSMIAVLLRTAGVNPSYAIGADVGVLSGNAGHGLGKYFVAEADESDGSFLYLNPDYAVITNIDKEHVDHYHNMENIIKAYREFAGNIKKEGLLICWADDPYISHILEACKAQVVTYGFSGRSDVKAVNLHTQGMGSSFQCIYRGEISVDLALSVPGRHNILNALACITLGIKLGIDFDVIAKTLKHFSGAKRRFEIKSKARDIIIVDDYAHHPTEIKATLQAAKAWSPKRVIGVFQPHRYSRTQCLKEEFGGCFSDADEVIITDIYAASEKPIEGVAADMIFDQVKQNGHKNVSFTPRRELKEHLMNIVKEGDMIIMLGAGDITAVSDELAKGFSPQI